ncbi:MAG: flagellar hook-associated protein FlgK [Acidobacteriota bacterium]|nr:flagellar hook-associated protein FlgK [Acidobacteriota bacterium]
MGNLGLSIAATGINASQTAMDNIAENLANTNTPGYVDQTANLTASAMVGPYAVGGGVSVTSITQANDAILATNSNQTQGSLAQSTALQQVLQQAQMAFQNPSSTSGLSNDLSNFWQSWDQVTANPSSSAARQGVIDSAQTVVSDLSQATTQLQSTTAGASAQLTSTVSQVNGYLTQMAQLNSQIVLAKSSGGSINSLMDQRNAVMTDLASSIGATGVSQPDGSLLVQVGGVTLVQTNWSDTVALKSTGGVTQLVAQTSNVTVNPSSGTTAGLMAAVNQYLPGFQTQLDAVANNLASTVNTQLAAGFTATGAAGQALFTGTGAGGIAVNPALVTDPTLIAAASTSSLPAATNDGSNAQAIANLYNSPGGPDATYRTLVQNVGDQVAAVNDSVTSNTSLANTAKQNLQAAVGVNQNNELVSLMNFQQTYQAAAKVISTVDSAVQSLLNAV